MTTIHCIMYMWGTATRACIYDTVCCKLLFSTRHLSSENVELSGGKLSRLVHLRSFRNSVLCNHSGQKKAHYICMVQSSYSIPLTGDCELTSMFSLRQWSGIGARFQFLADVARLWTIRLPAKDIKRANGYFVGSEVKTSSLNGVTDVSRLSQLSPIWTTILSSAHRSIRVTNLLTDLILSTSTAKFMFYSYAL